MPAPTKTDIVNDWFREHLANGPLARDTEAYNQVIAALPALITALPTADSQPAHDPVSGTAPDAGQGHTETLAD